MGGDHARGRMKRSSALTQNMLKLEESLASE